MLSAKNVVKPGYSVFIRQTTSAGVVWLLTTLSHSLYIVSKYVQNIIQDIKGLTWMKFTFIPHVSGRYGFPGKEHTLSKLPQAT